MIRYVIFQGNIQNVIKIINVPCCLTMIFATIGLTFDSSLIIIAEGELTEIEFKFARDIPTTPAEMDITVIKYVDF